jgi:excisionase family DNA binding protein
MSAQTNEVLSDALDDQLTVKDAVLWSKISKSKLYELMDKQEIGSYRLGGSRRVSRRSLDAYLAAGYVPTAQEAAARPEAVAAAPHGQEARRAAPAGQGAGGKGAAVAPPVPLAAALEAALACVSCSWFVTEFVLSCDPDRPDDDPAWLDIVRADAGRCVADLSRAVLDGIAAIPPAAPSLLRASPQAVKVRLPADPDAALPARSLVEATAHETVLALGWFMLHRVWRAGEPAGYRAAMIRPGDDAGRFAMLNARAVAEGVRAGWRELAAVLPEIDVDELEAACQRESAQAAV